MRSPRHLFSRIGCAFIVVALVLAQAGPLHAYAATTVDKSETVHVQTDATGSVTSITVDELLANPTGAPTLADRSTLRDITADDEGVRYASGTNGLLTWTSGGKQVSYQGTSDGTPPVDIALRYLLDGEEATPDELAGATGHLVMRIDYALAPEVRPAADAAPTPFVCLTVALLDSEVFSHVQVENGRVIDDKGGYAVIGFAMPEVARYLDLESYDLDLPDYLEIEADVQGLELDPIYTVVTPELFSDLDTSAFDLDADELDDGAYTLEEAMSALVDGSGSLTEALGTITQGSEALGSGATALREALGTLPEGTAALAAGAHELADGLGGAQAFATSLSDGAGQLAQTAQGAQASVGSARASTQAAQADISDVLAALEDLQVAPSTLDEARTAASDAHEAALDASEELTQLDQALMEDKEAATSALSEAANHATNATATLDETSSAVDEARSILAGLSTEGMTEGQAATIAQALGLLADADSGLATTRDHVAGAAQGIDTAQMSLAQLSVEVPESVHADIERLDVAADTLAQSAQHLPDPSAALETASQAQTSLADASTSLQPSVALLGSLSEGAQQLSGGATALKSALAQAATGAGALASGIDEFAAAAPQLIGGATQLDSGAMQLTQALEATTEGSQALTSGLSALDAQGIQSLVEALAGLGDEVEGLRGRIDDLSAAAEAYDNFAGKAEGQSGAVRFIYQTERIG